MSHVLQRINPPSMASQTYNYNNTPNKTNGIRSLCVYLCLYVKRLRLQLGNFLYILLKKSSFNENRLYTGLEHVTNALPRQYIGLFVLYLCSQQMPIITFQSPYPVAWLTKCVLICSS